VNKIQHCARDNFQGPVKETCRIGSVEKRKMEISEWKEGESCRASEVLVEGKEKAMCQKKTSGGNKKFHDHHLKRGETW